MNLKELSRLLDLSQTTVSRALNGYPEVSEATRARVVETAHKVGYRPNARARGLAMGRTSTIGHVIPVATKHEMVNPIFTDFIAGAGETYAQSGYDMQLTVVGDQEEEGAYRRLAALRSVDGVIVHGPRVSDPRIPMLQHLGLPFVVHGRAGGDTAGYSWMDVNNRGAFERATGLLLDLGHTRIGLINGIETMNFAARRRLGFEQALAARGVAADPALMTSDEMTEPYGYTATLAMLDQPDPPTALLISSIITAIGARRALQARGMVQGRDVSVICHDDALSYLSNDAAIPMFTATRSSVRLAGRRCAEMLLEQIASPDARPCHDLWEAELVLGASTGPATGKD